MKRIFFLLLCFSPLLSYSQKQDCKPGKGDAVVDQIQGIYIFRGVTPKHEYKFLGQVKAGSGFMKVVMEDSDSDDKVIQKLITRARKSFPDTDGIIIYLSKDSKDMADCVKFTED